MTQHSRRIQYGVVAALAAVLGSAVVGLGMAANGPSASAQQYEYGRKVTICHHTGSQKNPHRTITVSANAVPAHMRHGDTPGPCTTALNVARHSGATHVRKFHRTTTLRAELRAEAKAAAKQKKGKGKGKGK